VSQAAGPAFPFVTHFAIHSGMTLRDYFAAQAMPAVYGRVQSGGFERVAELAYQMADAMLDERLKPTKE
jgi:hypothetical protein